MQNESRPNAINKLVTDHRLTPSGRDWLVCALDPFHDYNHIIAGYPDADGSQTIVSCYQYQMEVVKPAGVVGNWDANVFTTPLLAPQPVNIVSEDSAGQTYAYAPATPTIPMGPLTVFSGAAGSLLQPTAPLLANFTSACLPASHVTDLSAGNSRVIGVGFEVTNTTAEMHKQGAVTVYRVPQYTTPSESSVAMTRAATNAQMNSRRYRLPPGLISQTNLLKGTRTWQAADGVYAVGTLSDVHNPITTPSATTIVFGTQTLPSGGATDVAITGYTPIGVQNAPPAVSLIAPLLTKTCAYDTTGAYFTGLSEETTLTVKLKVYLERAPTFTEASLAVLATPSAGLDTFALELYSRSISELPVAVTVGENGLGDWFRAVTRVVRDAAPIVANTVGHLVPGLGPAARIAGVVAGNMDRMLSEVKKEKAKSVSNTVKPRPRTTVKVKKLRK